MVNVYKQVRLITIKKSNRDSWTGHVLSAVEPEILIDMSIIITKIIPGTVYDTLFNASSDGLFEDIAQ